MEILLGSVRNNIGVEISVELSMGSSSFGLLLDVWINQDMQNSP
jgi:hypothetical protein